MNTRSRPAVFASPPAKFRNQKKRKCSFGSAEKRERKQNRDGILEEIRTENWDENLNTDQEYSPCLNGNWAYQVENHERMQQKAKTAHSRRHLELNNHITEEKKENKKIPNSLRKQLQPILTDPHRINQRQKQLDMGKNTLGYETYIANVQRRERKQDDPWTPDKYQQCSTRSWQGQVKSWRRRLHMWDPEENNAHHDPFSTSLCFNSEGDTNEQDSDVHQESFSGTCSQSSDETKVFKAQDWCDEEVFGSFTIDNSSVFDILPV